MIYVEQYKNRIRDCKTTEEKESILIECDKDMRLSTDDWYEVCRFAYGLTKN